MEDYWKTRPRAPIVTTPTATPDSPSSTTSFLSEFDRLRQNLLTQEEDEGWAAELRRYLKDVPADVTKETDIVEWWQVRAVSFDYLPSYLTYDFRIIVSSFRHSHGLRSTFSPVKHRQYPANVSSRQANKLLWTAVLVWVRRALKSFR
jgi:hypothetical protein